ncbi:hypothetical protein ACGFT2_05935 [Streptomyces sp. NPDC048514]|uniref:hypothetical protein n=1 Tax=Streptomyces sp. NPDC048514 TaxID=3365564 RepID=UPI003712455F
MSQGRQDGEPISNVYNATKQGVKLILEARQTFTADTVLVVQVQAGHPVLPKAPSSGGFEKRVPTSSQVVLMAAGKNDGDTPRAFFNLNPISSFNDCIGAFKHAGYTVKQATQDGEPIANVYRATKAAKSFTFERTVLYSLFGDMIIATP